MGKHRRLEPELMTPSFLPPSFSHAFKSELFHLQALVKNLEEFVKNSVFILKEKELKLKVIVA